MSVCASCACKMTQYPTINDMVILCNNCDLPIKDNITCMSEENICFILTGSLDL